MKKKLLIAGGIIFGFLAILAILPFAFEGKLVEIIKKEANKKMKARLEFSGLNLSFIREFPKATIDLKDFSLVGTGEFKGDTLVAADEIRVAVDLKSIFGSSGYQVSHILLDQPVIKLKVLKNGKANWDIMIEDTTKKAAPETASSFKMALNQVDVKNARFEYDDQQGDMNLKMNNVELDLSGDMTQDLTNLKLKADAATMTFIMNKVPYMKNAVIQVKGEIEADLKNSKYTFHDNTCKVNAIEAAIQGWFAMPKEGYDMDIKLQTKQIGFKEILSLVPGMYTKGFEDIQTDGKVSLDAWAKGHYSDSIMPAFNVAVKVADAMFKYPSLPKSVDQINMDLVLTNPGGSTDLTVINLKKLQFRMGGNPFSLMANVKTPISNPDFLLKANGTLDLNMIKDVYPLEKGTQLNGKVVANLDFKGKMSQIEKEQYEQLNAKGTLGISNMLYKSKEYPDVLIKNMGLNFSPKYAELTGLNMKFGKSDISATGKLENFIAYALKNKTLKGSLNMNSNLLDLNELMGSSSSSKKDTSAMSAFEVPKNIDFTMSANIRKILYDKMTLENATGKLLVKDGRVDLSGVRVNAFGGTIETSGYYSTATNPKKPEISLGLNIVNASFTQTFKELDFVKKLSPIFEKTFGNYSVNFNMKGMLDDKLSPDLKTLLANGLLQSKDVQVKDVKALSALATALKDDKFKNPSIKDLKLPFKIEDGQVKTSPFDIKLGDTKINLSGITGLDQTINYAGLVTLPQGISSKLGVGINQVNFKIGGTFTNPKVSLDYKAVAKTVVTSLAKQAATQGLQKALGAKNNEEVQAKIAAMKADAKAQADKIIEAANVQAQNLVNQAKNPIAKFAAQKAADKVKQEAQKKAQSIIDDADKKAEQMQQQMK
ncbi:AsmA-like C-terminal region-containing protein [Parabacteroides sp. FAFU027]|uniref:AsmA family protein n=1 Tax=Parabacteroides sp. FAFU027 TaxID=2922715 RepID=UPI001FAF2823|nr:AsmA-like C-terminal region-containing protein [Parabacteroides sp. FAFU027]